MHSADEAIDFLYSIEEIGMDKDLEADIREYAANKVFYPKRYKVRQRVYFIVIKTLAETMEDFKQKKALRPNTVSGEAFNDNSYPATTRLAEIHEGWYEGTLDFKRVVLIPSTGKFEYRDTRFVARCKASSGQDCYDKIIEHLRERVDTRSQFPSSKGKNFHFTFLGTSKKG